MACSSLTYAFLQKRHGPGQNDPLCFEVKFRPCRLNQVELLKGAVHVPEERNMSWSALGDNSLSKAGRGDVKSSNHFAWLALAEQEECRCCTYQYSPFLQPQCQLSQYKNLGIE
ncbi:hypothetical protein V6N13_100007 [Hibiscus sabdariffa]|uniref:Uncharacterized protein n=1 Tax=Hibiscus sabdariffa TaxID=183260 RepID=A0ABR1ZJS9_9ROSI